MSQVPNKESNSSKQDVPGAKGLEYFKKWNSFDFNGKYHVRKLFL